MEINSLMTVLVPHSKRRYWKHDNKCGSWGNSCVFAAKENIYLYKECCWDISFVRSVSVSIFSLPDAF